MSMPYEVIQDHGHSGL